MKPIRIWYQSFVDEENGGTYWNRLRAHVSGIAEPTTTIDINGITPYDSYVHPLVEWRCGREMISNAIRAEREGYDAFIVGHFQDTGLYEAKAAVDIPVIGLGEASMLYACTLGQRIALVSLKHGYEPWFRHQIAKYGLQSRVVGMHRLHIEAELYAAAWTDPEKTKALYDALRPQLEAIVAEGAEVLIPSGGGPATLLSSIGRISDAPVLDGVAVAIKMAETAVSLRDLSGLAVSRSGEFRQAPGAVIEEFLAHPRGL